MKAYLGIIGRSFAGKETVYQIIQEATGKFDIKMSIHHFSDPLNEALDLFGQEKNRLNQQWLSTTIRQRWGEETLGNIIIARVLADKSEVVCLDGIRRPQDVTKLRKLQHSHLIFVNCSAEERYKRGQARKDRPVQTWEQFIAEQGAEAESKIDEIGREADIILDNSGTRLELEAQIIGKIIVRKLGLNYTTSNFKNRRHQ